jgi:hypothetical protein
MNIIERVRFLNKNTDKEEIGRSLLRKAEIFCWESGLQPLINGLPAVFGEQAVLYFPGRSGKYALPCCEHNGVILLGVTADDLKNLSPYLLQSPGVEIWLKSGTYAGIVRLLSDEEQAAVLETVPLTRFFGEAGIGQPKNHDAHNFRLIEVTRSAPCTGSSGPGSKAWVWPLAFFLLLFTKKKK